VDHPNTKTVFGGLGRGPEPTQPTKPTNKPTEKINTRLDPNYTKPFPMQMGYLLDNFLILILDNFLILVSLVLCFMEMVMRYI